MRNTGTEYTSDQQTPVILDEMRDFLPALSEESLSALTADIQQNGCYAPIIVNQDMVIVDGHNRQSICTELGIPYKLVVFEFSDLLEAKEWALETQKGRRNLEMWELGKIALKLRPDIEARAKENMSLGGQGEFKEGLATLPTLPLGSTRKELADSVGIGERTMGKVMKIDDSAPQVIRDALDNKEISINRAYQMLRELEKLPEDQREQAAQDYMILERGKDELAESDRQINEATKIAKIFIKAFEMAIDLKPTEQTVRHWVDCCRMTPDEMELGATEADEVAEKFLTISKILRETIIPTDWRNQYDRDKTLSETEPTPSC
ncbi:hypothetical protein RFF05_07255 [Bengtsoniella intestinalis]|uniref:ParB N-terminal domain-containing protein n=1 Tax=Bengtsoniella intestinalis TaxID=3073143 RepID=UPI00391F942F